MCSALRDSGQCEQEYADADWRGLQLPSLKRAAVALGAFVAIARVRTMLLFLQPKMTHEQGVNAGGIETAHSVTRRAHQRITEEIETRVIEHRQTGQVTDRQQQCVIKRRFLFIDSVHADQVGAQNSRGECLAMLRLHATYGSQIPGIRAGLEVLID